MKGKWNDIGWKFCMNEDCPYFASLCPIVENQEICKFCEEKENEK